MQKTVRLVLLIAVDALLINASYLISLLIRFDFAVDATAFGTYLEGFLSIWIILTVVKLAFFFAFGFYSTLWKYAGGQDVLRVIGGVLSGGVISGVLILLLIDGGFPVSILIMVFMTDIFLLGGVRMLYRFAVDLLMTGKSRFGSGLERVMIVGSGYPAAALIKELKVSARKGAVSYLPVVIVEADPGRVKKRVYGVKIGGDYRDIARLVRRYKIDQIFVVLPVTAYKELEAVNNECLKTNCGIRYLPTIREIIDGKVSLSEEVKVDVDDILPWERVDSNERELRSCFGGRILLVTGAGSHLGKEICRQAGAFNPRKIIALDSAENGIMELRHEIESIYPDVEIETVICSTGDARDIDEIFENGRPHIVIQAGSFQNSRLMEENAKETVRNNIFGTMRLMNACEKYSAEKFILISSNKAGSADTVAGAVARVMEMMVKLKTYDGSSKTAYAAVRLGNVLGGEGSVSSVFSHQIEQGGPVTVSNENAERHFMSVIPATQLVLQSVSDAQGGEVFAVRLGQTINILYLAEEMIRLYGYRPYEDIDIVLTGVSAGEKLKEDDGIAGEAVTETRTDRLVLINSPEQDAAEVQKKLSNLWTAVQTGDNIRVKRQLASLVDEYIF